MEDKFANGLEENKAYSSLSMAVESKPSGEAVDKMHKDLEKQYITHIN